MAPISAPFTASNTIGALWIGWAVSLMFFGIITVNTWSWYQRFPKRHFLLKTMVCGRTFSLLPPANTEPQVASVWWVAHCLDVFSFLDGRRFMEAAHQWATGNLTWYYGVTYVIGSSRRASC
jgi:hypothetical protein